MLTLEELEDLARNSSPGELIREINPNATILHLINKLNKAIASLEYARDIIDYKFCSRKHHYLCLDQTANLKEIND